MTNEKISCFKKALFSSVTILALLGLASCDQQGCRDNRSTQVEREMEQMRETGEMKEMGEVAEMRGTRDHKDILMLRWAEMKGKIKEEWGELTDDELTAVEGRFEKLSAQIQRKYQITKEEADKKIKDFIDRNARHN